MPRPDSPAAKRVAAFYADYTERQGESAHICSTYQEQPSAGECPAHAEGWRGRAGGDSLKHPDGLWCYEHREWHHGGDLHDECEACEHERNTGDTLTDDELTRDYASGAVCDSHLTEEHYA